MGWPPEILRKMSIAEFWVAFDGWLSANTPEEKSSGGANSIPKEKRSLIALELKRMQEARDAEEMGKVQENG